MPIDPHALENAIDRLSRERPRDDAGTHAVLQHAVDACARLFDVSGSGIMLADEQSMLRYVASSDEPGRELELAESTAGEGPCTAAFVYQETVDSPDTQADERWPAVAESLQGTPVRAVLGVPVRMSRIAVGTLDVYKSRAGGWDDSERTSLDRYAEVVGDLLGSTVAERRSQRLADQLQYALDYRVVIERGVGYLMARDRVDAAVAFNSLRGAARHTRARIGHVAERLLATGSLPTD